MGDAFDFMDAVQLKYPENFDALITSKKWKERFDVVEELLNTCKKNPKLDPKSDYNDLIGHLRFIVEKDANINVQAVAVKLVNALAYGLRSKFVPHASQFFPLMFERFKEKKPLLRDPLAECCDSLAKLINLETILDDVVAAMGKPNPQIKQQVDQFIFRQLVRFSPVEQPKKLIKTIVPVLLKHAEDPDKDVRDCSLLALGGILRLTSDTIFQQLAGDVTSDANKMAKVKEGKEKAETEFAETQAAKQEASDEPVPQPQSSATTTAAAPTKQVAKEPDPWEFLDPVDVLALLPKDFYEGVAATKWSERKDALDNLLKLITDNPKLDPKAQYGEIMDTLGRLLAKDSNINVCSVVAKIVAGMAKGLRAKFGQYASTFMPIIFDKFKEKKAILRDPLIEAIDAVYSTTDLNTICDAIMAALNKPNPDIKTQTNKFLYRVIKNFNVKTAPTKTIKILTPVIVKCTGESVLEGREAAFSAIGAIMKAVGKQNATVMLGDVANDKIKMAQIEKYYNQAVEETGGESVEMVQSVHKPVQEEASAAQKAVNPKSKPKVELPKESDEEEQTKAEEPKQPQGRSASKSRKPVATPAQKSPEPQESAGVFTISNLRNQRLKDEKNLKALKWNFKAPTEEHTQQLMDQFAAVSKPEFVKLMFGKDFKFHLKALDQISAQLQLEPLAVMNNCDLILKWATFRFFDTNPQSLNKTLEVLLQMLVEMEEKDVKLNDADVASFLPYLLLKSGDTKDVVRLLVRKIVHQTSILHVPQKIFPLILDALTSKNSRQKAECLALANTFLEYFGISIATNQQQAMKTIAGCIAERDSNARNAALNCIGTAWMKDGDRVLTMIGNINPKEKAMLDERIKRIARDPQPMIDDTIRLTPKEVTQTRLPVDNETPRSTSVGRTNHNIVDETTTIVPQSLSSTYVVGNPIPSTPRLPPSGKFALSRHHYAPLPTVRFTTIPHIDFGLRPVEIPPQLSQLANSARTAPTPRRSESALSVASSTFTEIEPEQVERTVYALSSTSIQTVIDATSQLVHLFRDQNNHVIYMLEKADFIAKTIATQFSIIRTQHLNDRESDTNTNLLMRSLCNFLTFFMHQHSVVCRISHTTLKLFFSELLRFLCDERTSHLADHQHIVRSVNVITVKLCENSDINEGLVSQLHLLDSCLSSNAPTKLIELLQKCMFKQSENFQKNKTVPVQIDRLLTEIDAFFSKYYHNTTNKRVMDSLKLIIQRIVAATFMDLDPYLTLIKKGTPFYVYLTTCITKLKDSQAENVPPSQTRTLDEMFNDLRQNITPAVLSEIYFYCEKYPEMKDDCDRLISTCPTPSIIDYCFTEFTSCRDADKPTSFHHIYSDLVAESGQMGVSTHTNGFKHNGHEKVDVSLPFAVIPPKLPTATSRSGPVYSSTPVKSTSTSGVKQDEPNISPIPNEQVLGYKKRLSLLRSNMNN